MYKEVNEFMSFNESPVKQLKEKEVESFLMLEV